MSVALKHMYVLEQIALNQNITTGNLKISRILMLHKCFKRFSNIENHFGFSLVLEDDQILPNDFLRQVVEVLLQVHGESNTAVIIERVLRIVV